MRLDPNITSRKVEPFAALLSVSTLLIGLLYVAGYAYRWAYFYNFGVQHLVNKLGFQSFLVTGLELIRTGSNLSVVFQYVLAPILILHWFLLGLTHIAQLDKPVGGWAGFCLSAFGLRTALVVDLLFAAILVFGTFKAGYVSGFAAFTTSVANTPNNPLPTVTVMYQGKEAEPLKAIRCGAGDEWPDAVVGDTGAIELLHEAKRSCTTGNRVWRLLFRDDDFIYIFAGVAPEAAEHARPLTLTLPNAKNAVVMTE